MTGNWFTKRKIRSVGEVLPLLIIALCVTFNVIMVSHERDFLVKCTSVQVGLYVHVTNEVIVIIAAHEYADKCPPVAKISVSERKLAGQL